MSKFFKRIKTNKTRKKKHKRNKRIKKLLINRKKIRFKVLNNNKKNKINLCYYKHLIKKFNPKSKKSKLVRKRKK